MYAVEAVVCLAVFLLCEFKQHLKCKFGETLHVLRRLSLGLGHCSMITRLCRCTQQYQEQLSTVAWVWCVCCC